MTWQAIIERVKELGLPEGQYIVFGSAPMALAGLRETNDIDLLVTVEVREQLANSGWAEVRKGENDHPVTHDVFEAHDAWNFDAYQPTLDELLSRAVVQNGVPFASLEDVRRWKEAADRPKDVADRKLIRDYQARLSSTSTLQSQVETALDEYGIRHEVLACDPSMADTAAFCEHYGFTLEQAANTLLVASRKTEPTKYALCVVLGTTRLDVNKKVCELLGVKRASFADAETTRELTGMEIGGVVAIGTNPKIPVYIDSLVLEQEKVVMGGGNRTSKIVLDPKELQKLPQANVINNLAKDVNI
ncbi:hypothetical protein IPP75_01990 [Candidatus Saccharibacteria bacterium]|nr:MAG: hypothetical protein IPP75_01990 [Candidatus Saccharibacteria bacterium]